MQPNKKNGFLFLELNRMQPSKKNNNNIKKRDREFQQFIISNKEIQSLYNTAYKLSQYPKRAVYTL